MRASWSGDGEIRSSSRLLTQSIWFLAHTAIAIGSWLALMMLGTAFNPVGVSQLAILLFSMFLPLLVGFGFTRWRQDQMATLVWLLGLIWFLIVCLSVLDLPTGPNACFQCDATEKLMRTFFSLPRPSGLIDDDGPFIATWPAAALLGYSIGAKIALRREN
jgi:hypothetical protein